MKQTRFIFTVGLLFITMLASAQDSTARKELMGKYKFPAGSVVEEVIVLQENGMLMMNSTAGTSSLEPVKGDTFNIVNFNGIAVFKRNDIRKVIGVHIDASGYVLDGVKDSLAVSGNKLSLTNLSSSSAVAQAGVINQQNETRAAIYRRFKEGFVD